MSEVALERISHRFPAEATAKTTPSAMTIDSLTLDARSGELLALLGPSGCGKTTTLRIVAGFVRPDAGRVLFDRNDVTAWPPERRGIGMVFQSYALFPHLDVFENVAFGLRTRAVHGHAIVDRVRRALRVVGLDGTGLRTVQSLSGGQQQRVALARAIVVEPRILLLDEPLSNLDAQLREETRAEIRRIQREIGITTLYVTHDREEALAISDRIAVLRHGKLEQVGTPTEVFERPSTAFVAGFVGGSNVVVGRLEFARDGSQRVSLGKDMRLDATGSTRGIPAGASVVVAIRPSALRLGASPTNRVSGRVMRLEYRGDAARLWIQLTSLETVLEASVPLRDQPRVTEGSTIELSVSPEDVLVFPSESETSA